MSEIVFASGRGYANLGGLYFLSTTGAPMDVSRSLYRQSHGAISPDGALVAFWSDPTGSQQVYLARSDGTGLRQLPLLSGTAGWETGPLAFSPDGSKLLVSVMGSDGCTLFLVDVQSLQTAPLGVGCATASPWSPDGSRIAAIAGPGPTQAVVDDTSGHALFSVPGGDALWSSRGLLAVVSPDGASTAIVDEQGSPVADVPATARAWSRDGSRLVLTRPGAIILADSLQPLRTRVLVQGPNDWSAAAAFTPDGGAVAYQSPSDAWDAISITDNTTQPLPGPGVWAADGRYAFTLPLKAARAGGWPRIKIEIGDTFGRNARPAGVFPIDDHAVSQLTWSADGSRLLFESSTGLPRELWAVRPDGSHLHRLTPPGGPDASAPAWSADGRRLAYTQGRLDGMCGLCDQFVAIATADGRVRTIMPGDAPSWAPSGKQLVVSVCCSGELDVVTVNGRDRRMLAPGPAGAYASSAAWSPDGRRIAYATLTAIDLIAPNGTGRRPLTRARRVHALAWSHDGKLVAYSTETGIYTVHANGSTQPRRLAAAYYPGRLSFSPDDSRLVYSTRGQLLIVPVHGGKARPLAPSPCGCSDPAWRP